MANSNKKHLHIMDMDGTILDSMPVWINIDDTYLISKGITPPDNIARIVEKMTIMESCAYFHNLGVDMTPEEIYEDIMNKIYNEYLYNIPLKGHMNELFKQIKEKSEKICLFTSSERRCAIAAFERLGILNYFDAIYTSVELGIKKTTPASFLHICNEHGYLPQNTYVYEDALYAIKSAKMAGCHIIAVSDASSVKDWEEIKNLADEIIE